MLTLHIDPLKTLPLCNLITTLYHLCVVVLFNRSYVVILAHGYAEQYACAKILTTAYYQFSVKYKLNFIKSLKNKNGIKLIEFILMHILFVLC